MLTWRFLKPEIHNAFFNMAVDEAMLLARIKGKVPNTLRLYQWRPSAVSFGRFQNILDSVNLENCTAHGIDVVRRISGGGAVYHDSKGEITYSVVVGKEDLPRNDVASIYRHICDGLIEAAQILGVDARYSEGNIKQCPNIVVGQRKISGNAQAHKKTAILHHGTFLIDVDFKKMFSFLRIPIKGSSVDPFCVAQRKITSIAGELGRKISSREVFEALRRGFEEALDVEFVENSLTSFEYDLACSLKQDKFETSAWNFEGSESQR